MVIMQVFRNPNGFSYVKSRLIKLGMEVGQLQQVFVVLSAIQDLLAGARTIQTLSNIGVTKLPDNVPSEDSLVQLLYAYLVQWIGKCSSQYVTMIFVCIQF